ncbi:MAG: indolepyruvate ferredoxin oxidoreductase subunit alpha [Treponema sp.]|jgi:indolepyruvate ferredoxin oxidoreductase alpha subunit|nr:indolepyruvate ferredoxin oxidoreductase subunit alpha [Treponema sp.]
MKKLLMGNEAAALGAIRAGVRLVSGYPGTPSTEILETAASYARENDPGVYVEWSVNEKAALEVAAGAAMAGARALVTMKQVGLNVASDPLMSLNYLGVEGGLVVAVADDPGPLSSQTEQDTRRFGKFAKLAVFDPSSPEEAYAMMADAFACSEKYRRPVLFRPTTRICHSYASVEILDPLPSKAPSGFDKSGGRWVIFPGLAYRNHIQIEKDLSAMGEEFSSYGGNLLYDAPGGPSSSGGSGPGVKKGIASGGVSWAYTLEALEECAAPPEGLPPYRLLKTGVFPFSEKLGRRFLDGLEEVLVLEELDPVIEDELIRLSGLYGIAVRVRGKYSGDMPRAGENTAALAAERIRAFLLPASGGSSPEKGVTAGTGTQAAVTATSATLDAAAPDMEGGPVPPALPPRPPVLCAGCPHRASFFAVKEAFAAWARGRASSPPGAAGLPGVKPKAVFSGDIGCYTLGNAPPLDMTDTCLCMGAGITVAQGINRIEPGTVNFAFIGDSTFFHTGIPGIVNAVYNRADIVAVILDNKTTAMTGNQPHPGTGKTAPGFPAGRVDIYAMLAAAGVKHIERANPFHQKEAREAAGRALLQSGVRALLFEAPCIMVSRPPERFVIDGEKCTGCGVCVSRLGCPAISLSAPRAALSPSAKKDPRRAVIDESLCTGCGICGELCAFGAIGPRGLA